MEMTSTNIKSKTDPDEKVKRAERTSESVRGTPAVAVSGNMAGGAGGIIPASSLATNKGGGGAAKLPLRQSQLLLDELPGKDGVGDPSLGSLRSEKCQDIVGDPDGDPGGPSSFCHSVGHYSHAYGKSQPRDYLESYDNVSSWLALTCDKSGVGWFIAGECQNGHRFAKELVCGKEWCEVCGEDGSVAHLRRFARWLPKVQQLGVMGYFVFTIPQELRSKYRA
ncbi:unnamed protein product, partial [marine sediment metagenome]